MFRRLLNVESGYSLIEVLASIVILTLAIVPMVAMFDTGLRGVTSSSNFDKARALANLKMEEAKSLPFDSTDATVQDVNDNFPEPAGTTPAYDDGPGRCISDWKSVTGPASADFTNFQYRVEKQYMNQPTAAAPDFTNSPTPTRLIRLTITVRWGSSNTYTTFGLVTE